MALKQLIQGEELLYDFHINTTILLGYRESAAFLTRAADQLEEVLIKDNSIVL